MKDTIAGLLKQALQTILDSGSAQFDLPEKIGVERTRDPQHGDLASNVAMALAKQAKMAPRQLAQLIVAGFPQTDVVSSVEIAGPGFLNFRLATGVTQAIVERILNSGDQFGQSGFGANEKVLIEFISANPTGPLHVGHGRHAAYGACLVNILKAAGYDVASEYYINDAGRQMDILAVSLWLRYLSLLNEEVVFPANGYQGDYIIQIAKDFAQTHGDRFKQSAADIIKDLPADEPDGGDKEIYIDAIGQRAKDLLGADNYSIVQNAALNAILDDIKQDLEEFGVTFDRWFSERSLTESGGVTEALEKLQKNDSVFEKEGALWFRASAYGDDKDRVVQRANGQRTYFASDIAYHLNKRQRGHGLLLDVLGSDHHGYVSRVRAGLQAMGEPGDSLEVRLMQFVSLYRQGERVAMSSRGGQFVTLRELRHEVGNDAARYFYVMRSNDQHLDFDLDLAKSQRDDNPVFYVQYAHARVSRLLQHPDLHDSPWDKANGLANLEKLVHAKEDALMSQLSRLPEVIQMSARNRAPQTIVNYLREVTAKFHSFYNDCRVMCDDIELRDARLCLAQATAQVLRNGLGLLGVSAPEKM